MDTIWFAVKYKHEYKHEQKKTIIAGIHTADHVSGVLFMMVVVTKLIIDQHFYSSGGQISF